jgi:hypothetical protein
MYNLLIVVVAMSITRRHIRLLNGIPRDISRRLYTMTSEGKTGRVEDTIREKVNWTRFLMTITTETDRPSCISLEVNRSATARIAFYHK